jgi:uncharacterized protein YcbK (DUF882 family)
MDTNFLTVWIHKYRMVEAAFSGFGGKWKPLRLQFATSSVDASAMPPHSCRIVDARGTNTLVCADFGENDLARKRLATGLRRYRGNYLTDLWIVRRCAVSGALMLAALSMAGCVADQQASLNPAASSAALAPSINQTKVTLAADKAPAADPVSRIPQVRQDTANAENAAPDASASDSATALAQNSAAASIPVPVARPDFGDRIAVAATVQPAPAGAGTLVTASDPVVPAAHRATPNLSRVADTSVAAATAGQPAIPSRVVQQKPVRVASAAGTGGLFAPLGQRKRLPGLPGYEDSDPEPALSPSAARMEQRNLDDSGKTAATAAADLPQTAMPQAAVTGPVIVTTAAYAPAVIEVNGISATTGAQTAHSIIRASVTSRSGSSHSSNRLSVATPSSGRYWRAAYPHVVTRCFGPQLRNALDTIGRHFGREVEVTSGHRTRGRRRSMHRFCKAADIRVAGVRPSQLARFARTIPGINGVGTYRRKSIVHIDTRLQEMVWRY